MSQAKDDLRARLQGAALELYRERGFDGATAADIAALAGVTERTFFRYFADKREVLFDEDPRLRPSLAKAVADAPAASGPLEIVRLALQSIEPLLQENRPFTEPRALIIAATPALRERAEAKSASLAALVASALQARGIEAKLATLAARAGLAAFGYAAQFWFEDPSIALDVYLERAFQALRGLSEGHAKRADRPI